MWQSQRTGPWLKQGHSHLSLESESIAKWQKVELEKGKHYFWQGIPEETAHQFYYQHLPWGPGSCSYPFLRPPPFFFFLVFPVILVVSQSCSTKLICCLSSTESVSFACNQKTSSLFLKSERTLPCEHWPICCRIFSILECHPIEAVSIP